MLMRKLYCHHALHSHWCKRLKTSCVHQQLQDALPEQMGWCGRHKWVGVVWGQIMLGVGGSDRGHKVENFSGTNQHAIPLSLHAIPYPLSPDRSIDTDPLGLVPVVYLAPLHWHGGDWIGLGC